MTHGVDQTTRKSGLSSTTDAVVTLSRKRRLRRQMRRVASIPISLGFAIVVWQLLSGTVFDPFLIPPPTKVLDALIPMAASGELFWHTALSLSRVLVGFVTGSAAAVLLGLLMGRMKTLEELFDPIVEFLRFLSPTAMIPIAVIWFGIGEMPKYFLVFWGTFFIVLISTVAGVMKTPKVRQDAALCLGASREQIFRLIVFPSAIPHIVTGMRVALASAFVSIIPAELIAAGGGLGYLLQTSSLLLQTDRIFVALVTISTVGFATDRLFRVAVTVSLRRFVRSS
jgi:ABC-type nitrate/sulfonate/bicarbonate transport system permease component